MEQRTLRAERLKHESLRKDKFATFFNSHKKVIIYIVLLFWLACSIYPFIWAMIAPFNHYTDISSLGINPIPKHGWTTENYDFLFQNSIVSKNMSKWLSNSFIYSICNATVNVFFNFLAGFALSRIAFRSKKMVLWYLLAGTMIPAQVTQIPQLIILIKMGVIGSNVAESKFFIGIIFTSMTSATWVFMARQYYMNIGVSAEEAGSLDGLSTFGTFFRISLRQVIPLMATMWTLIFMAGWNNYIMFTIWSGGDVDRMNLTAGLGTVGNIASQLKDPTFGKVITLTATNVAALPVMIVYLLSLYFQKKQVIEGEK